MGTFAIVLLTMLIVTFVGSKKIGLAKKVRIAIVVVVLGIIALAVTFPTAHFGDNRVRTFAASRLFNWVVMQESLDNYTGRVLGTHVLETNLGEITLKSSSHVSVWLNEINSINVENFKNGFASHNLELWGNALPEDISIGFSWNRIDSLRFFDYHDITLSGISFTVEHIEMPVSSGRLIRRGASRSDIYMPLRNFPQAITLADSTEIHIDGYTVFFYKGNERWMLADSSNSTFHITRPGETESARYATVHFEPDWGGFIEGLTLEEQEAIAEENRRRNMAALNRIRFGR